MTNEILPFYNNQMSNWNSFLPKKNKKKIPKSLGIVDWHLIKKFGLINIKKFIKDNFSTQQINKSTLLDIGCNDGYLTENIARLKFKKVLGIEPRNETILKGKKIRKFLAIKTYALYKKLSINQLKKLKTSFDITICSGVLHHTDNFFVNLRKILAVTKKYFILEGEFISDSQFIRKEVYKSAQLKDPLYNLKKNSNICGITVEKLESNYANGSTLKSGFVQIVSIDSAKMYAKILGYNLTIYRKKKFKNLLKSYRAILIFSKLKKKDEDKIDSNLENEIIFFKTILPYDMIYRLNTKKSIKNIIKKKFFNIVKSISISPKDKILLETAKYYMYKKNTKEASLNLEKILKRRSGDWFSQYRALYLLYLIDIRNFKKRLKWKRLLIESNYYFPKKLFNVNFVKKNLNVFL
jgi:SAM-dependent methyltransferase